MSFVAEFNALPMKSLLEESERTTLAEARQCLDRPWLTLRDFARLISPAAAELLEPMSQRAQQLSQQRFGKVGRLFAPLYLSNECVNNCKYCGFSRDNSILRVTLSVAEVRREAEELIRQGFRNILLVSGEHPKFASKEYLAECVRALHELTSSVSLEIGTLETEDYRPLVEAGADGLVLYQETYDRPAYAALHTAGPKRDYDYRLAAPERAYAAGFRRIGLSPLYGLADWRQEALSVVAHTQYLLRHCWKTFLTLSMPRLRPCAGDFQPLYPLSDRDMVQLVCALRLTFPDVGLVLSTREPSWLRDGLIPLGITLLSAGSHTEPGGYTGAGQEHLHRTEHGRIIALAATSSEWGLAASPLGATGQFEIADARPPQIVADQIRRLGYEPVWKDWDAALTM